MEPSTAGETEVDDMFTVVVDPASEDAWINGCTLIRVSGERYDARGRWVRVLVTKGRQVSDPLHINGDTPLASFVRL